MSVTLVGVTEVGERQGSTTFMTKSNCAPVDDPSTSNASTVT